MRTYWNEEEDTGYHDNKTSASENARVYISEYTDDKSADERDNIRVVENVCNSRCQWLISYFCGHAGTAYICWQWYW
jgi:hypothetical protein